MMNDVRKEKKKKKPDGIKQRKQGTIHQPTALWANPLPQGHSGAD